MTKILVIDDEPRYVRLMEANLKTEGFEVIKACDGESGVEQVVSQNPDLVILDIMMPGMDGFATCHRIREFSTVPIIVITAKGDERDRVRGLDLGADDYIVKPFSATEMLARVRAVLRMAVRIPDGYQQENICHDNLRIELARAEVFLDNKVVYLSATEYRILLHLARNIGKVVSSEQLLCDVWGDEYVKEKEILWVSISRLRQKLERDAHQPKHIVTRSGVGYTMPALE
jgi:DNA-binding response OmpR family regulator